MASDGRLPATKLSAAGYKPGQVPVATGAGGFKPGASGGLWVSDLADGPPDDGSVFWYVTDESC